MFGNPMRLIAVASLVSLAAMPLPAFAAAGGGEGRHSLAAGLTLSVILVFVAMGIAAAIWRQSRAVKVGIMLVIAAVAVLHSAGAFAEAVPGQVTVAAAPSLALPAVYDFTPIILALISFTAAVITAIGGMLAPALVGLVRKKLEAAGIHVSDLQAQQWSAAITKSMSYGVEATAGLSAGMLARGNLQVDMKQAFLANSARYVQAHFPDIAQSIGIPVDSSGSVDARAVAAVIESRMGLIQVAQFAPHVAAAAVAPVTTSAAPTP